ncbi:MAG: UDP-N-acetylmuramate dehydrogenase [Candidatus Spechtbacteria bacterium]|nr:UDP-N-acetylmuramate dehydrogenase [Candidatus Spechtbacteria bacterium]
MTIKENIELAGLTSLRVGGPARYFTSVKNERDARLALSWAKKQGVPYFVLGGGTNVVMSDNGYHGLVITTNNSGIEFTEDDCGTIMKVMAGTPLQDVVDASLEQGLAGLEWAAGVPGQVGGAVRGNAGAFGGETRNVIESVDAVMPNGKVQSFSNADCHFAYRSSIFKEESGSIILSVVFRFMPGNKAALTQKAEELRAWRRERHPLDYPNCGSVFKRIGVENIRIGLWNRYPDMKQAVRDNQVATAYFIDKCDLKNFNIGGAEVSGKHPNFIINRTGNARAEHIVMVASHMRTRVREKFGIILEEEPEFVF